LQQTFLVLQQTMAPSGQKKKGMYETVHPYLVLVLNWSCALT